MKRPVAAVVGTGRGLPAHVMTNHDFASIGIETSHEWIVERSGIVERRLARNGETTCSMAADASRKAMEVAGVHPGEIDIIVLSTATPDRLLPSTAVDIQAELGATRAAAFDVGAACAGWLYAMSTAGNGRNRFGDRIGENERDRRLEGSRDMRPLWRRSRSRRSQAQPSSREGNSLGVHAQRR